MIPVKFGIAFTAVHLNQSGALVTVYTDGSVLLTHGGTEMGQGLHTKMVQVAATTLGIPAAKVHVMETSTDKVRPAVHTLSTHYEISTLSTSYTHYLGAQHPAHRRERGVRPERDGGVRGVQDDQLQARQVQEVQPVRCMGGLGQGSLL